MSNQAQEIIDDIHEKYGEWLEMSGEKSSDMMNQILINLLIREREDKEWYKKMARSYVSNKKININN